MGQGSTERARYRKKPVTIDAAQWFAMGDHPNVVPVPSAVRDTWESRTTNLFTSELAWIGTLEAGHVVSPGDWIITGVQGEQYPCKPDIFEQTYDAVESRIVFDEPAGVAGLD